MAPSKTVNDVLGALGGALLASMMVPQLYKLYKTRRAVDISLLFLFFYILGSTLTIVYLFFEGATVAYICLLVETGLAVTVGVAKIYLDHWGPYSHKALASSRGPSEKTESGTEEEEGQAAGAGGGSNRVSLEGRAANDAERGAAHPAGTAVQLAGGVRQRGAHS